MSETKFTKGEWCISTSQNMDDGIIIHRVNDGKMSLQEGISNARLFEQSKEMCAILERIEKGGWDYRENGKMDDDVKKALAKVRGES